MPFGTRQVLRGLVPLKEMPTLVGNTNRHGPSWHHPVERCTHGKQTDPGYNLIKLTYFFRVVVLSVSLHPNILVGRGMGKHGGWRGAGGGFGVGGIQDIPHDQFGSVTSSHQCCTNAIWTPQNDNLYHRYRCAGSAAQQTQGIRPGSNCTSVYTDFQGIRPGSNRTSIHTETSGN